MSDLTSEAKPAKVGVCARIKQYGLVFLVTFFGIWAVTFAVVWMLVRAGIDTTGLLLWLGFHRWFGYSDDDLLTKLDPRVGIFGVTYILTGLTEPLRLAITLYFTPAADRWLRANAPGFSARFLPARDASASP